MSRTFLDNFKYIDLENYKELNKNKGVYLIRNIINNNLYVGSTISKNGFKERLCTHNTYLKKNMHDNIFLQNSVNKYGIENFKIAILLNTTTLTNQKIREIEKEYIDFYGKFFKMFNLADPINYSISEYSRQKMKDSGRKIKSENQGIYLRNNKFMTILSRVINNKKKKYCLGTFNTLEEAKICYLENYKKDSFELEHFITKQKYNNLQNTKTGYFGVVFDKNNKTNSYFASTQHNKKQIHLGVFSTAKEAAIAYNNYLLDNGLVSFRRPLNIITEECTNNNI